MTFFGRDRREKYRVKLLTTVQYSIDGRTWAICDSVNISNKGMLISCQDKFKKREKINLRFILPDKTGVYPIEADARVTRVVNWRGKQLGLAVDFLSFVENQGELVKKYIDDHVGETMESISRLQVLTNNN